ncbi:MAG: hypothetical protein WBB76_04350 [Gaiellaceae bacterium]
MVEEAGALTAPAGDEGAIAPEAALLARRSAEATVSFAISSALAAVA